MSNRRQPSAVAARPRADERSTRAAATSMHCCLAPLQCPETFASACRLARPACAPAPVTRCRTQRNSPLCGGSATFVVSASSGKSYLLNVIDTPGQGNPMLLNITKIDRLVIELKLPPADAFFMLRHVIDEMNSSIRTCPSHTHFLLAPELGNVVFASPTYGFSFALQSFALKCVFARLLQRCIPSCFSHIPWRVQI